MSGVKYDAGKTDMGLLFIEVPRALEEASKALQLGSEKYGVGNWMRVENGNPRYLSALVRHLTAYYQGEKHDKESGLSHLAHVATNALFLLDLERQHDDEANSCGGDGGVSNVPGWPLILEEEALSESVCGGCGRERKQAGIQRGVVSEEEIPSTSGRVGPCLW